MNVRLTVHRSAHEIGGNCIEIAEDGGHGVILDANTIQPRWLVPIHGIAPNFPSVPEFPRPIPMDLSTSIMTRSRSIQGSDWTISLM
jgi:hypothetical protein